MTARAQGIFHEVKSSLAENDSVFAELEDEKRKGWESSDVEKLWQLRSEKLNNQQERVGETASTPVGKSSVSNKQNPFAALTSQDDDAADADLVEKDGLKDSGKGKGSHIRAGKGPSHEKYYDFYRKLLPSVAPDTFGIHSIVQGRISKRFLDVGCAPGGLSCFFVKDLGWSGLGFTLDLEKGGLRMKFKDAKLSVCHADLSMDDASAQIGAQAAASDPEGRKYDFINLGVVMGKHQVESIGEDRETSLQILRVNANSFRVMLGHLAQGGDILWVFPSSNVGSWFYFLEKLRAVFDQPTRLFSTLVPSRSPVYALCRGFKGGDHPAAREWLEELDRSVVISDAHLERWNLKSWAEAQGIVTHLREEFHKIWSTQRKGLEDIRRAASMEVEKQEELLKRLSGSRQTNWVAAAGGDEESSSPSQRQQERPRFSSAAPTTRADFDGDWRRQREEAPAVARGPSEWQTVGPPARNASAASNGSHRNSTGSGRGGSGARQQYAPRTGGNEADSADSWRRG